MHPSPAGPGHSMTWRPATFADKPAVLALLRESEIVEVGQALSSRADVDHFLAEPGVDLVNRSRIVLDGDRAVGLVLLYPAPQPGDLRILLIVSPDGASLTGPLLDLASGWVRADGTPVEVTLFEFPRFVGRDALASAGWAVVRDYVQLTGNLADLPVPRPGDESIVRAAASESDLIVIHQVIEESVAKHWQHKRREFADFLAAQQERDGHDPSLWMLAELDGEPAGALITRAPAERAWIGWLGVREPFRHRGLAGALLRTGFAALRARGQQTVGVDVDAQNETGAVAVYQRLGFTLAFEVEEWLRRYD